MEDEIVILEVTHKRRKISNNNNMPSIGTDIRRCYSENTKFSCTTCGTCFNFNLHTESPYNEVYGKLKCKKCGPICVCGKLLNGDGNCFECPRLFLLTLLSLLVDLETQWKTYNLGSNKNANIRSNLEKCLLKLGSLFPFNPYVQDLACDFILTSCLFNSCTPIVVALLRNDCFTDIAAEWKVYGPLISVLCQLASTSRAREMFFARKGWKVDTRTPISDIMDGSSILAALPNQDFHDVYPLVEALKKQAQSFLQLSKTASQNTDTAGIVGIAQKVCAYCEIMDDLLSQSSTIVLDEDEECPSYVEQASKLAFEYTTVKKQMSTFPPCTAPNLHIGKGKSTATMTGTTNTLKVAKEIAVLSGSLPISDNSSVFLRVDEDSPQYMQALIVGPPETPYENGLFLFDIFLPPEYPNVPPRVNFRTTGNGTVRFNPNLYNNGKVCLSILNTWTGSASERWIPNKSTLLQVLVSIQSMILVDYPYFNEPGYGAVNPHDARSIQYNINIRQMCAMWAMENMLKNPPVLFKDVVQFHFRAKRDYIISTQFPSWQILDGNRHNFTNLASLLNKL